MSITGFAAEPVNVAINADYNGDGTADYSWILPGVVKTEIMTLSADLTATRNNASQTLKTILASLAGKEVTVYTVSIDTVINEAGSKYQGIESLTVKDGLLTLTNAGENSYFTRVRNGTHQVAISGGGYWDAANDGGYIKLIEEGYYVYSQHPWNTKLADLVSGKPGSVKNENYFAYSTAILHVVSKDEAAKIATSAPAVAAPATSPEEVAKIQQRFDNWYSNILLAVNATQGQNNVKTNIANPVFYSYDAAANAITTLTNVNYTIGNGSITFTTPTGGVVIISEGQLIRHGQ